MLLFEEWQGVINHRVTSLTTVEQSQRGARKQERKEKAVKEGDRGFSGRRDREQET